MKQSIDYARCKRLVIGLVGHDIHVVANRILSVALEDAGFFVCNLKTNNTVRKFVDAAIEIEADAVLLSSLNGEAESWCQDFRKHFQLIGMGDIVLYAGGNLVIGGRPEKEVIDLFLGYGFNRVFYQYTDFNVIIKNLIEDLTYGCSSKQ